MVDLHQNSFGGLTRKIQERQVFCKGAYLKSIQPSKKRSISQNFFEPFSNASMTKHCKAFQNGGSKINQLM